MNNSSPLDSAVSSFIHDLNYKIPERSDIELSTSDEVKSFILLLKNNKSPGLDGINSIILKNMPDYFFETL